MSSLFQLPTSDTIPDPSAATDRITLEEVSPRSSSLDGAITLEFTSSPQRWWSPADSYMLIGFNLHKSNNAADAWEAIDYDGATPYVGASLALNAGSCVFSQMTLSINGVLMGTLANPAQVSGLVSRTELSKEYCETVGSVEGLNPTASGRASDFFAIKTTADLADRTAFEIVYKPPLGFLRTMKAYPGVRVTLTCTVSPDYPSRMLTGIAAGHAHTIVASNLAAPVANTDYRLALTSVKYFAGMMSPLNNPVIPQQTLLPMFEVASSAQQLPSGLVANSLQTMSFTVPSSTFKIAIALGPADAGTGSATRGKEITHFRADVVNSLSVAYAGFQSPNLAYNGARDQPERSFTDFTMSCLASQSGKSTHDSIQSWHNSPIFLMRFAKPASDISTNATVRLSLSSGLGTAVNVYCFAYFQSTAQLSYDSSGMCNGAEYAYAS